MTEFTELKFLLMREPSTPVIELSRFGLLKTDTLCCRQVLRIGYIKIYIPHNRKVSQKVSLINVLRNFEEHFGVARSTLLCTKRFVGHGKDESRDIKITEIFVIKRSSYNLYIIFSFMNQVYNNILYNLFNFYNLLTHLETFSNVKIEQNITPLF